MKSYFVFLGRHDEKYFHYMQIDSEDIFSETKKDISKDTNRIWYFEKKIFSIGSPMSVYEVEVINEGKTVSYNKKKKPVTYWINENTRKTFMAQHYSAEAHVKSKRDNAEKTYLTDLKDTKEKIQRLPKQQRAFIIGEIINYLMN